MPIDNPEESTEQGETAQEEEVTDEMAKQIEDFPIVNRILTDEHLSEKNKKELIGEIAIDVSREINNINKELKKLSDEIKEKFHEKLLNAIKEHAKENNLTKEEINQIKDIIKIVMDKGYITKEEIEELSNISGLSEEELIEVSEQELINDEIDEDEDIPDIQQNHGENSEENNGPDKSKKMEREVGKQGKIFENNKSNKSEKMEEKAEKHGIPEDSSISDLPPEPINPIENGPYIDDEISMDDEILEPRDTMDNEPMNGRMEETVMDPKEAQEQETMTTERMFQDLFDIIPEDGCKNIDTHLFGKNCFIQKIDTPNGKEIRIKKDGPQSHTEYRLINNNGHYRLEYSDKSTHGTVPLTEEQFRGEIQLIQERIQKMTEETLNKMRKGKFVDNNTNNADTQVA